jgi:uncharacterized protein YrzB (UPF0473 family)
MGSQKMINLINENGEINRIELLCAFEVEELNGKYIIYTKNERTAEGHCIIYSGKIITKDKEQQLVNIEDGEEWEKLKNIMKQMTKYSIEGDVND